MSTRRVYPQGNRIVVDFPFDLKLLETVRELPDRDWNKSIKKRWSVPRSPWHCAEVVRALKPLGFVFDSEVTRCANSQVEKPDFRLELPENLYPYQVEGVQQLYNLRGRAILGDGMGLGKSPQSLVFANLFGGEKILIVSPANVLWKWALKEINMWASERTWQIVESSKQPLEKVDILIMSYAIMVSRFDELKTIPFDTMIFDEAHYLKSNKSQRNKVARKLVRGVPHLLFLTGTPFKNKRIEMYQLLHMLNPKTWPSAIDFGRRYAGGVFGQGHWIIPPDKETNTEELQKRLQDYLIRRTKDQVGDQLPELVRVSMPMRLDNEADYDATLRELRAQARREGYKPAHALTALNKLRQIVGRGKVQAGIELAEDILEQGEKVVLFAYHREIVRILAEHFSDRGVGVIDGSTPARKRQMLSEAFQHDEGHNGVGQPSLQVMIVSTAGREGIDLFASNQLVMVERLWTASDEEQVEARLHRDGQKNNVTVHYLVAQGTVDERLDEIVRTKRDEFGNLLDVDVIREIYTTELLN